MKIPIKHSPNNWPMNVGYNMVGVYRSLVVRSLAISTRTKRRGGAAFYGLTGSLMWLSTQAWSDVSNAVRAVARYCAARKYDHWKPTLSYFGHGRRTLSFGITLQKSTTVEGLRMQVFADAGYASKATDSRSVSGIQRDR